MSSDLDELLQMCFRVCSVVNMYDIQAEVAPCEPHSDETVAMHFMGSGGSDRVTFRNIRELHSLAKKMYDERHPE